MTKVKGVIMKKNVHKIGISFIAVCILVVIALNLGWFGSSNHESKQLSTKLYLGWIYTGTFGGEVVTADKLSQNYNLEIELIPGGPGMDPFKLLKDGEFAISTGDEIIRAISNGAEIVVVGTLSRKHPGVFASLESSGITSPKDFEGHRVGRLPFGGTGNIYDALISRENVNKNLVTEVIVSPDLRPFIDSVTHDVQPIFIYDEPVTLQNQNIQFNIIDPTKHGVNFVGASYFTTRNTYEQNPELVSNFLNAVNAGWRYAAENPAEAIELIKKRDSKLDSSRELEVLKRAISWFEISKDADFKFHKKEWQAMIDDLISQNVVKSVPKLDQILIEQ